MHIQLDLGLSDREKFFIAEILSQWGAMEHIVFLQTLATFGDASELPKQMNNVQFSKVLKLWMDRVVEPAEGKRRKVLRGLHARVEALQDHRNALVHGMWTWDPARPSQITTIRVRGNKVVRAIFTADDLQQFALDVSDLHLKIRYPCGNEDLAADILSDGYSVSRGFMAMMTGDPVRNELYGRYPTAGDEHVAGKDDVGEQTGEQAKEEPPDALP